MGERNEKSVLRMWPFVLMLVSGGVLVSFISVDYAPLVQWVVVVTFLFSVATYVRGR